MFEQERFQLIPLNDIGIVVRDTQPNKKSQERGNEEWVKFLLLFRIY
jgi:hypothetical protein